jgi:membrane fusion protein (multidrug efflux system)
VKEGQDVVNLEKIDPVKVDFRVPEINLDDVRDGQTLQVTLDALPGRTFDGRVYAINPLLDASGRAVVVRAVIPNAQGRLRPGMFARVRLFTAEVKESLAIPEESVFPVGEDKYVYRVVDGHALRQKVEIGVRREGVVEIVSGLGAADRVVTAGQIKLRDGAPVRVAAEPAMQPGAASKAAVASPPAGRS